MTFLCSYQPSLLMPFSHQTRLGLKLFKLKIILFHSVMLVLFIMYVYYVCLLLPLCGE